MITGIWRRGQSPLPVGYDETIMLEQGDRVAVYQYHQSRDINAGAEVLADGLRLNIAEKTALHELAQTWEEAGAA